MININTYGSLAPASACSSSSCGSNGDTLCFCEGSNAGNCQDSSGGCNWNDEDATGGGHHDVEGDEEDGADEEIHLKK